MKAAALVVAGKAVVGGCISANVLVLAEQAARGMFWMKAKLVFMVMGLGLVVGGVGWSEYGRVATEAAALGLRSARAAVPAELGRTSVRRKKPSSPKTNTGIRCRQGRLPGWDHNDSAMKAGPVPWFIPRTEVTRVGSSRYCGILIWDAATGKRNVRRLTPDDCSNLAVTPDGLMLAVSEEAEERVSQAKIGIWELENGKKIRSLSFPQGEGWGQQFGSLCFSPDGKTLAAVYGKSHEGQPVILDTKAGRVLRSLGTQGANFYALAISPDGKTLATAGEDFGHRVAAEEMKIPPPPRKLPPQAEEKRFSTHSVKVWDLATGKLHRVIHQLTKLNHPIKVRGLVFSPARQSVGFRHPRTIFFCFTGKRVRNQTN